MNKAYRKFTEFFCGKLNSTSYTIFERNIILEVGTRGICANARDTKMRILETREIELLDKLNEH